MRHLPQLLPSVRLFPILVRGCVPGVILLTSVMVAQERSPRGEWSRIDRDEAASRARSAHPWILPDRFEAYRLDRAKLEASLAAVRAEGPGESTEPRDVIQLPTPEGGYARFRIVEAPVMEPGLAAKFPGIKTYRGQGIDDPAATVRFDITPAGFHAQIISPHDTCYIDPLSSDDPGSYGCYYKKDYTQAQMRLPGGPGAQHGGCVAPAMPAAGEMVSPPPPPGAAPAPGSGNTLRTYRLACAATGEYTAFHGGSAAAGLAAVVTAINRVTGIYEVDLAVRLVLVANNDQLIFTDGATDPYTNEDAATMLGENQATCDSVIGSEHYDLGHVFGTGGTGVAYFGVVCDTGSKAYGATGRSMPTGDPFWIDLVAHEIGHQFGARHTFNGTREDCSATVRNPGSAWEPGSGSTIMAYAGFCGSDNLQPHADPHFHGGSYEQIRLFVEGLGNGCATPAATGNTPPAVDAGPDFTIPVETPFALTAVASDPDAGAVLTYAWEERDLGPARKVSDSDNGSSPLFRCWPPATSPTRTFPRLADLLANATSIGEQLPTRNRVMTFAVMVRDNQSGGGGAATDRMRVTVTEDAGPFEVLFPNRSNVTASGAMTVTWDVANTDLAPVSEDRVNILLSTDGGQTWPTILAADTANDGSETVVLPGISSAAARIRVEAADNIFFDISDEDFTLEPPPGPVLTIDDVSVAEGDSGFVQASFTVTMNPASDQPVTVTWATQDNTASAPGDYATSSGLVEFAPGEGSRQIVVAVAGDGAFEDDETFFVNLGAATGGAVIGDGEGVGTIFNDDPGVPVITSASGANGIVGAVLSYQVTATGNPVSFGISGALPPGLGFDPGTGEISGIPEAAGSHPLTISATNAQGTGEGPLTIDVITDDLTDGLDGHLTWTTGDGAGWFRVVPPEPTRDGVDAARSGAIADGERSFLETTVTGPDLLSFMWKVSSEQEYDFLLFQLDGITQFGISGERDWHRRLVSIPAGEHTLQWLYEKDASRSSGEDAGFLDLVSLDSSSPAPLVTSALNVIRATGRPFFYEITATGNPVSFAAAGLPAGLALDSSTGVITGTPAGAGRFVISLGAANGSGSGAADLVLDLVPVLAIGDALDSPAEPWVSGGGNADWFSQSLVTHDGIDAAQAGDIGSNGSSSFELPVTGPDILSFWWRTDSQAGADFLRFEIDAETIFRVSGTTAWERKIVAIPAGGHTIRWRYTKDSGGSDGADTGWVDEIVLQSNVLRVTDIRLTGASGTDVEVSFRSTPGISYSLQRSNTLETWTTIEDGISGTGAVLTASDPGGAGTMQERFYRLAATPE